MKFVMYPISSDKVFKLTTLEYTKKDNTKVASKDVEFVAIGNESDGGIQVATAYAKNDTHVVVMKQD